MEEEDEENVSTQRPSEAEAQKVEMSQKKKQHHLPTIKEIVSEENAVSPLKFKREQSMETPKRL